LRNRNNLFHAFLYIDPIKLPGNCGEFRHSFRVSALHYQGQKRMAQKTAARGRPKGTGLDDAGPLAAIAEMISANPGMKPTTAIKAIGITDPSTVRRLRDKYQQRHTPRNSGPNVRATDNVIAFDVHSATKSRREIRPQQSVSPKSMPPAAKSEADQSPKAADEHPARSNTDVKPDLLAAAFAASVATGKTAIHLHYKTMWYAFHWSPFAFLIRNTEFTHLVLSSLTEKDETSR
jgi:hypothetical protein